MEDNLPQIQSGIGLKNVKRRLELTYPSDYQLTINEDDINFEVDLVVNLKKIGV